MSVIICGEEYNIEKTIKLDLNNKELDKIPKGVFDLWSNQIKTLPP